MPTLGQFVPKSRSVDCTSLPHTSQPGGICRANSSTRGRSPMRATILSRASSGFLLWASIGEMINWWMLAACRLGWPRIASRQTSALARVQKPVKPAVRLAVFLEPDESHAFVGEAPFLDQPQGLRELGKGGPQEKCAVRGRKIGHRQRTKLVYAHGGVMMLRRPLQALLGVAPRGIGVDDGICSDNYTPFPPRSTASRACSMRWMAGP